MGMAGNFLKLAVLSSLLMIYTPSFSCPNSLPKVSWSYEVSPKMGKEYRKVDVEIVKIERVSNILPDNRLSYATFVNPDGFVRVEVINKSNETIRDVVISHKLEGGFEGLVRARRVISKNPLIVEDFITAPYKLEGGNLYIGVPAIHAGEQLQLEYSVKASVIYRPRLVSPVVRNEETREKVVRKYSFYLPIGKVELRDKLIEKLMVEVNLLPSGEEYKIRVKGYADSVGNIHINKRIAKERAMNLVKVISSRNLACIENQRYADSLTGTPLEAK